MKGLEEVVAFLQAHPVQYVATVGLDGKPKNRPFMFALEHGGRLWFCTANTKDVYAQMQNNPWVEVAVSSPDYAWLRISGKACFEDNKAVKKQLIDKSPLVKSLYQTPENPVLEVFYLSDAQAIITDFSGNPPKEFLL